MAYTAQLASLAGIFLISCISPGPDFVAVTSNALMRRKAGVGAAVGVAASHVIWSSLAVFGLGLILAEIAWLYAAVRYAGAAYLIYLGAKMLWGARHAAPAMTVDKAADISWAQAVRRGFLVGMTNPKATAFFGSLFVTLLPVGAPNSVHVATVAIVAVVSCGWFTTLAVMFSHRAVRDRYQRIRRPMDALTGAVLFSLGVRLAVAR